MPRAKPGSQREAALVVLCIELFCIYGVSNSIHNGEWRTALLVGSIAIAIPIWAVAVKAPAKCGFLQKNGARCPSETTGVLLGCGKKGHTWGKFFAHFGWDRRSYLRYSSVPGDRAVPKRSQSDQPSSDAESPILVKPVGTRRDTFIAWSSAISGIVSAIVGILALR
jgi:hypothetical protein